MLRNATVTISELKQCDRDQLSLALGKHNRSAALVYKIRTLPKGTMGKES